MESAKLNVKGNAHKLCILHDKVVTCGIWVNHSKNIYIHWNQTIKYMNGRYGHVYTAVVGYYRQEREG